MKMGNLWKWESSPRARKVSAHNNWRKKMGPTQITWGREKPGRTITLSPHLRLGDAAIHGVLIVSKQPGAL